MATSTTPTRSMARSRSARPALTHLAQHVFGVPLAYQSSKLEVLINAIGPRLLTDPKLWSSEETLAELRSLGALGKRQLDGGRFSGGLDSADPVERREYQVTPTGVAIIPIQGSLMKKCWGLFGLSGASSYEAIGADIECAATNPEVSAILLDVDSPGGETHGLFELSDLIYSLRSSKPIWAVANDLAASAAYTIASSASRLYVTRTGGVGSIGIVSCHMDQSGADAKAGLKFTYVFAGDRKIDGNPHQPMSGIAKSEWQSEVDRQYAMFTEAVARNRSMDTSDVVDTEARVYYAETAIPIGLANAVGTFEDALAALEAEIAPGSGRTSTSLDRMAAKVPSSSSDRITKVAAGAAQTSRPFKGQAVTITQGATMKKTKQALAAELEATEEKRKKLKAEIVAIDTAATTAAAKKAKMKKADADAEADAEAEDATADAAADPDCPDAEADDADYSGEADDAEADASTDAAVPDDDEDEDEDEDDKPSKPASKKKAAATATIIPIAGAGTLLRTSGRSPIAIIAEVCELAGKPNMATKFIRKYEAGAITVKGVRNYFLDQRAKASSDERTTGAVQPAGATQLDSIEAQAVTLAASSAGKLTKAQAYVQLLTKNPQAYAGYVKERNFGIRDAMASEKYLQTLGQRFPTGVLG